VYLKSLNALEFWARTNGHECPPRQGQMGKSGKQGKAKMIKITRIVDANINFLIIFALIQKYIFAVCQKRKKKWPQKAKCRLNERY